MFCYFKDFNYLCYMKTENLEINKEIVMWWLKKNWKSLYYIARAWETLIQNSSLRDLGKLMAEPNEWIVIDKINEETTIQVKKSEVDKNGTGFDIVSIDEKFKIQSKLRAKEFHLENTRRKSQKNIEGTHNGHVRYSVGEADIYIFSRPFLENYGDIDSWSFIAIPECELIDPKHPNFLIGSVPTKIWKKYEGKFSETIEMTYQSKVR
jgi:hypothetical protein